MQKEEYPPWPSERIHLLVVDCLKLLVRRHLNIDIPHNFAEEITRTNSLQKAIKLIHERSQIKRRTELGALSKSDQEHLMFYEVAIMKAGSGNAISNISEVQEQISNAIEEIMKRKNEVNKENMIFEELEKLNKNIDSSFSSLRKYLLMTKRLYHRRKTEIYIKIKDSSKTDLAIEELNDLFLKMLAKLKEMKL